MNGGAILPGEKDAPHGFKTSKGISFFSLEMPLSAFWAHWASLPSVWPGRSFTG
jgi:hypothetical protein